jgi:uncharacterized RDD family membrane protein YckC
MADDEWFYAVGGDQHGPVSRDWLSGLLRDGQLHVQSLVWTTGMPQWQPAESVPALARDLSLARVAPAPPDFYAADLHPAVAISPDLPGAPPPPPAQLLDYGLGDTRYVPAAEHQYATFGTRFVAFFIDTVLLRIVAEAGVFLAMTFAGNRNTAAAASGLTGIVIAFLYFTLMESSPKQATLGKMAMGLRVTTVRGQPISFGQAVGRYFGKWLSSLILGIGYLMIMWTDKHQGLHDQLAGTVVIKKR